MYQLDFRPNDEMQEKDSVAQWQPIGNTVWRVKDTVPINPDYNNQDVLLEVIDVRNVAREEVCFISVCRQHLLTLLGELQNDTAKVYKWTRANIEFFITMPIEKHFFHWGYE